MSSGTNTEAKVPLPTKLQAVDTVVLEEYVRERIIQFAHIFAKRIDSKLSSDCIEQTAVEVLSYEPSSESISDALENKNLQLVFRHDCLSLGCADTQCVLCEHNPHRRCNVNFAPKYLVNDVLKAKCEASIRVEVIDKSNGMSVKEGLPNEVLELCILDGNAYDSKCSETEEDGDLDLSTCCLLMNNRLRPLLQATNGSVGADNSKVVLPLVNGVAELPDLHVSDSSEAMLSGRKPPFRLLVKLTSSQSKSYQIKQAVSEGFVVATRRTRTAGKVEIPNIDDHISKLEHMGKETVKKLQDIQGAGIQAGININVPDNCIFKVGDFQRLAIAAEKDGHLRQKLQQILKLNKEKWDEARDHAMRAVVADNRLRIWYCDKSNLNMGLLYLCHLGNIEFDRPVGTLWQNRNGVMEALLMSKQTPSQREQVRKLQTNALSNWWQPGHPGWAIFPMDSDQFVSNGDINKIAAASMSEPDMIKTEPELLSKSASSCKLEEENQLLNDNGSSQNFSCDLDQISQNLSMGKSQLPNNSIVSSGNILRLVSLSNENGESSNLSREVNAVLHDIANESFEGGNSSGNLDFVHPVEKFLE